MILDFSRIAVPQRGFTDVKVWKRYIHMLRAGRLYLCGIKPDTINDYPTIIFKLKDNGKTRAIKWGSTFQEVKPKGERAELEQKQTWS